MGLKNLQLFFDNPQHTYFSGQTVSGRLIVQTDAPKKLRSIMVKFKGEAKCHWSESRTVRRNGKSERVTTHYRGHEIYFENRVKVFGGSGNTESLPAGEHCFPFSMMLANHLPSSFEGKHGHVRYTVKAILDRPWKFDHEVMTAFTVLSHVDLNLDPRNREPFKTEDSKHFCCCCCKSGPLTLATHIPARGYVPGQSIPMTVEVDNASNVRIYEVVCELQKIVTYHATAPHKTKQDSIVVAKIVLDGSAVEENDSKTWAAKLNVPPLPPSLLPHCSVIDVDYKLKIKANPEGLHGDLKNSFPITIGTIPLWQSAASQPQHGVSVANPHQPMPMPAPTAPPPEFGTDFMSAPPMGTSFSATAPYPDLPPPTYEECMFGTSCITDSDDNKYMFGTKEYNPRYPTYTLQATLPGNSAIGWAPPK